VTSNPYSDPHAIRLTDAEMKQGDLQVVSFARPLKVFAAHTDLVVKRIALLREEPFAAIIDVLVQALQGESRGSATR
jgi:mRNA interferase MazF